MSAKKRLFKRLEEWQVVFSPKLKIVWSMLQMLTLLGICFGVQWPAQYEEVVRAVEEGVNLNFLKLVTVSCWQEWTWHHTLLLRTLAPSALIAVLMGVVALARMASGKKKGGGDGVAATLALELISTILFLVFPGTSAMIFTAFVPRSFECGGGECDQPQTFLAADLGIEYYSQEHATMRLYAGAMIAVWPLGVPLLMITMFLRNRKGLAELRAEQSSYSSKLKTARLALLMSARRGSSSAAGSERSPRRPLQSPRKSNGPDGERVAASLAALEKRSREEHEEAKEEILVFTIRDRRWIESRLKHYELRCAWFDIVEIARKLLLTGFAILLEQGSLAQLVSGCLLASAMLALTALLKPYKHVGDNILAIGCQAAVVANLALAILLHGRRAQSDLRRLASTTDNTDADAAYAEAVELDLWEERVAHGLIAAAVTPIVGAVVLAVAQLRRAPSRSPSLSSRLGLRRRHPAKAPRAPTAESSAGVTGAMVLGEGKSGELPMWRRAASGVPPGELARQPTLLRDLSGCHRPPLAAPPAIERWKAAGLTVRAVSRMQMEERATERVERARAGSVAAAEDRPSLLAAVAAAAADRPSAFVVRASSSVTDEMISEECSTTSRTVSMRI